MDKEKLIEAAKFLKDFCEYEMHGRCFTEKCLFSDGERCVLRDNPSNWTIPKPRRWTDREIALAKALKAFGAQGIGGRASVKFAYCIDDTAYPMPYGAFAALNNGEEISIDEIIAEEEQWGD